MALLVVEVLVDVRPAEELVSVGMELVEALVEVLVAGLLVALVAWVAQWLSGTGHSASALDCLTSAETGPVVRLRLELASAGHQSQPGERQRC